MWQAISRQWFLWLLAICLSLGFGFPATFSDFAHSAPLRNGIVFGVMLLMGWTMRPQSVIRSLRQPLPSILAIVINIAVVPLLAWPAIWFLPHDLAGGLIVASLVPCTLASAAVWTRSAGGDDAIAMVTTVVTNLFCFVVAPVGLWMLLGQRIQTDVTSQMQGLLIQVVVPLVAGQSLRYCGLASWADCRKTTISSVAQVGILLMVLLGSAISAERMSTHPSQSIWAIVTVAIAAWAIHLLALAIGYFAASVLGIQRPQQLGIAIAGGQKTLMVGLQLAMDCGVSVMPMVLYHVGQLLIDTLIVRWWTSEKENIGKNIGGEK